MPTQLATGADGEVAIEDDAGRSVRMRLLGADGAGASVNGAQALYQDVMPDVDLELQIVPEGLKEDLVLKRSAAPRRFVYLLQSDGSQRLDAELVGGGVTISVAGGDAFAIPAPVLVDARGDASHDGSFSLRRVSNTAWRLTLEVQDEWLDAPERSWPVRVDPTVHTYLDQPQPECEFRMGSWGTSSSYRTFCAAPGERIVGGSWRSAAGEPMVSIGLMRFNTLTLFQNDAIESATLRMHRLASSTPNLSALAIAPSSTAWRVDSLGLDCCVTPDQNRKSLIPPGGAGPVQTDMSEIVNEWRRWNLSGGTRGIPNHGLVLFQNDRQLVPDWNCWYLARPCDWTKYAASSHADPALRPVLEVRSWPAAPAGSAITSPREGELSGRFVELEARAWASSVTGVQFQYIAGNSRRWLDIPVAALRTERGDALSSATIPVTNRRSERVVWDLAATPGGEIDGPVHVRAYLESPLLQDGGATAEVNIRTDRTGLARTATAPIGPGEVDLMTGEFSLSESDVTFPAFLQDLTLSRTYTSRGVARRNHDMFGPGWEGSIDPDGGDLPYKNIYNFSEIKEEVETRHEIRQADYDWELFYSQIIECLITAEDEAAAGGCFGMRPDVEYSVEAIDTVKRWEYRYAVVEFGNGTKAEFTQTVDPNGNVTGWVPSDDLPGYRLDYRETSTPGIWEFILTEPGGGVARFRSEIGGSPNHRIASYQQAGSTQALSYTYEPSGNRQRLKRVTAPNPSGGTPRWMELTWSNVGNGNMRVVGVTVGSGTGPDTTVAQYAYSARGLLLRAWDPRVSPALVTEYVYDNRGLLTEVRPPGEEEWRLAYDSVAGDAGYRLLSASRDHPAGGSATRTLRYDVPVTGSGAPYDMSLAQTSRWSQQVESLPRQAVAVFPEDDVPSGPNVDYGRATIHYLDINGREVNVARPGGHISYTGYDVNGNVIRQMTASNRERALAAGASSATVAHDLTALNTHSSDGVDLLGTWEPTTEIELSDGTVVTGRRFTSTHYDQGSPGGRVFHLPTSRFRGVDLGGGNHVDVRKVATYAYDGLGGLDGWNARHATQTIVDPDGLRLTSYSFLHPQYPIVEETRRPRGAAGGARPDVRFYQYAGITPSSRVPAGLRTSTVCEPGTPSGFLCMDSEGTVPDADVPRRWYAYNAQGLRTDTWESRSLTKTGAPARQTSVGYDAAGRETSRSVSGGLGEPVPTTTFTYSPTTGRQVSVSAPGRGTISRVYDSNGRLQQYTDASGLVTRYAYDLRGRITQTVEDGSRTVRYGYDDRDNLVSVTDPELPEPITADFNADGQIVEESLPDGIEGFFAYDETGRPETLRWEKTVSCTRDCVWVRSDVTARDADGKITGHRSTTSRQTYRYDSADRLDRVDDVRLADERCVRQQYAYDVASNRTRRDEITGAPGMPCGTGNTASRAWTHDTADRVTTTGWVHDAFGRATTVPAPDSGGRGGLSAAYYTDDRVRQLTLDGRSHTYERDPLGRTASTFSTGGSILAMTSRSRFADDTDTPVAVVRSDGSVTREITGPSDQLLALQDETTLTYQLRDVHGSIVATVPAGSSITAPAARTDYDAFGKVMSPTPNVLDWTKGTPGYGWLGAHQRTTQFEQAAEFGPPAEMGARVYLPGSGRFLQVDPIDGGSANHYDYGNQDPINSRDLDGCAPVNLRGAWRAVVEARKKSRVPTSPRIIDFPEPGIVRAIRCAGKCAFSCRVEKLIRCGTVCARGPTACLVCIGAGCGPTAARCMYKCMKG